MDTMYGEDYGEDGALDECTCDPCDCDCAPNGQPKSSGPKNGEYEGEDQDLCTCDPCECETPPQIECTCDPCECDIEPCKSQSKTAPEAELEPFEDDDEAFQLDEFSRAKAFFMKQSTKSGISLYDHLSEVIRQLLDKRAPTNPVDYIEEISMNVKRYRFEQQKDVLQDVFYISEPVINDARFLSDNWKKYSQWSDEAKENPADGTVAGNFQNLLRLQYYLEQVNIGLPREEMFRLSLAIKELTTARPFITKARFWGKVFGFRKNYYVVEADIDSVGNGAADLWQPPADEPVPEEQAPKEEEALAEEQTTEQVPGAQATLEKAGNVVLNAEILSAYSKTSGLSPEDQANLLPKQKGTIKQGGDATDNEEWAGEDTTVVPQTIEFDDADTSADYQKWQGYQQELMTDFPTPKIEEEVEIPPEDDGTGVNRRAFYVCNDLGQTWTLLPPASPQQINLSRRIRYGLTGELDASIRSFPAFPGKEGNFLKSMLARASAGSLVSPKGFYKAGAFPPEFEDEDEDLDEEEEPTNPDGDDKVVAVKKYSPQMDALTNPDLSSWVHHACPILPQGRNVWWNPVRGKKKNDDGEDTEYETEDEDEEFGGEDEGENGPKREVGLPLFTPISSDIAPDGRPAWSLQISSSVFKEFQVASVRSNNWPGSAVICTIKGKVDNIYLGDGQKFMEHSYAPFMFDPVMKEYKPLKTTDSEGLELSELQEFSDPTVEEEQKWLNRLELEEIGDIEDKFVDNEEEMDDTEQEYSDEG